MNDSSLADKKNSDTVSMDFYGITKDDLSKITDLLKANAAVSTTSPATRAATELLSATFIISILTLTPPILKSLAELLSELRKSRYYTFKLTGKDGKLSIEGVASPDRIEELKRLLSE